MHHCLWCDGLELRNTEIILLSVESKRERTKKLNCLSIQDKENSRLIYAREGRKTPCRLPKLEPEAEYQCRGMGTDEADGGYRGRWGQARPMEAGEANGGRKPLTSSQSQPVPKAKQASHRAKLLVNTVCAHCDLSL